MTSNIFKEIKTTVAGTILIIVSSIWLFKNIEILHLKEWKEFIFPSALYIIGFSLWFAPDKIFDIFIKTVNKEIEEQDNKTE